MVPLWDGFTEPLHEPFQQRSAAIGVWLLHAHRHSRVPRGHVHHAAEPADRSGARLQRRELPGGGDRARPAARLRVPARQLAAASLLLVVAVARRRALERPARRAHRVLAYYEVGSPLHGPFHVLHGLFVAGVGYVVLFAGLRVLAPKDDASDRTVESPTPRPTPNGAAEVSVPLPASVALILVFLAHGFERAGARRRVRCRSPACSTTFPLAVRRRGRPIPRLARARHGASRHWPGADVEIARRYRRRDGAVVDLYLGYFASQRAGPGARDLSQRGPAQPCRADARRWRAAARHSTPTISVLTGVASSRMFWYDIDAKPEASRYVVKARTLWNASRRRAAMAP